MALVTIKDHNGQPLARVSEPYQDPNGDLRQDVFLPSGPTRRQDAIGHVLNRTRPIARLTEFRDFNGELISAHTVTGMAPAEWKAARSRALRLMRAGAEQARRWQAADKSRFIRDWVRAHTGSKQAAARVTVSRPEVLDSGDTRHIVTMPVGTARHLGLLSSGDSSHWFMPSRLTGYLGRHVLLGQVKPGRSLVRVSLILAKPDGPPFSLVA